MKIAWMLTLSLLFLAGCASGPPADPNNICNILANEKGWKKDARKAQKRWGLLLPLPARTQHVPQARRLVLCRAPFREAVEVQ